MNDFDEQFDTILPQALGRFVSEQIRLHQEGSFHIHEDPSIFFHIKDAGELLEFIMNHDYWGKYWSNFLLAMLVKEIYHTGDFQFSLN